MMEVTCDLIVKAQEASGLRPAGGVLYNPNLGGKGPCGCALGMLGLAFEKLNPRQYRYGFVLDELKEFLTPDEQMSISHGFDDGWSVSNLPNFRGEDNDVLKMSVDSYVEGATERHRSLYAESFKAACILRNRFGKSEPLPELPEWI